MHLGGFERLQQATAPSAFHDAGDTVDPPKCHPHTRTAIINKIMDWILGLGVDDQKSVILWLYGPAGAGKSAIAHDIAQRCDLEKLLLASFFFSRSDPARSNAKPLIATISYQIAINIPGTREKIASTIEHDPLILTRSLEAQITALIVEPLREPLEAGYFNAPTSRRLIIIDGLDECDTPAVQCSILQTISLLFHNYHLPLLILVASRPERHLTHSFHTESNPEFHTTLALDDTYKPDDDIRLFLTDNFKQVKATHPMRRYLDYSWPSVDVLEGLVKKSSGQFIYASTVVKYVSSIRHQPADRLNVVLGIRTPRHVREMPFGELDALYTHIFTSIEDRETVLLILGFSLLQGLRPWFTIYPSQSMDIGDVEQFFLLSRGDIEMLFGDLSSLVVISNAKPYIHLLHASLGDFLLDPARSKEFYIDLPNVHTTCMHLCFRHNKQCALPYFPSKEVVVYPRLIDSISKDHGGHTMYAAYNLIWHCENTPPSASLQLREEIMNFSLHRPDSCFANTMPGMSLFYFIPQFLKFIKTLVCPTFFACLIWHIEHMEQPFDGIDGAYNQKLGEVLNFFTSKLPLYFSSSRLTLLLTLLDIPPHCLDPYPSFWAEIVPLPSRLKAMDDDAHCLHSLLSSSKFSGEDLVWNIFRDFLESAHPLAFDRKRHAAAASACLQIIFTYDQMPLSQRTLRVDRSRRHRADLKPKKLWHRSVRHWDLRTYLSSRKPHKIPQAFLEFQQRIQYQHLRSGHLKFLLKKSAYSNSLLNFVRRRVFRFRYLQRNHPTYMKKVIFALAKYIHRVTGETAEVRACQSIWGRQRWFTVY